MCTGKVKLGMDQNKTQLSSNLSPTSMSFTPSMVAPLHFSLSANVPEFVPSWNRPTFGGMQNQSIPQYTKISDSQSTDKASYGNNILNKLDSGNPTKETTKRDNKNNPVFKKSEVPNETLSCGNCYMDDPEFPALSSLADASVSSPVVSFSVSFSDKLKVSSAHDTLLSNDNNGVKMGLTRENDSTTRRERDVTRDKPWSKIRDGANANSHSFKENRNCTSDGRKKSCKQSESSVRSSEACQDERPALISERGKGADSDVQRTKVEDKWKAKVEAVGSYTRESRSSVAERLKDNSLAKQGRQAKRKVACDKIESKTREGPKNTASWRSNAMNVREFETSSEEIGKRAGLQHNQNRTKSNKSEECAAANDVHNSRKPPAVDSSKYESSENAKISLDRVVNPNTTTGLLSYSDMLRRKPDDQRKFSPGVENPIKGTLVVAKEQLRSEEEVGEAKTKSKKKKKKKKACESATPQPVKKTKEPIVFDFGDMFAKLEKQKNVVRSGTIPLAIQAPTTAIKETKGTGATVASSNPLDSTAPIVYRRKERETPKKKKPSAMRKLLIKDRTERKMAQNDRIADVGDELRQEDERKSSEDEDVIEDESPSVDDIKKSIHSRNFREYCDHSLDYDINGAVIALIKELIRFQDRLYQKDPIKARAKRRFVCGLREVHKHLKLKKLKCVIVTPNMEPTKSKGGLSDVLCNIIESCHSQNVPVVFSLNRQILGKVLLKKVPVSIVGIFYYDGAQNYFKLLMELTEVARQTYQDKFNAAREKLLLEKQQKIEGDVETQHEQYVVVNEQEEEKEVEIMDEKDGERTKENGRLGVT